MVMASGDCCSSSTGNYKDQAESFATSLKLIAEGKKYYITDDFASAVATFDDVLQLVTSSFGETASQCEEAYFWYGKSLLELARTESGVLGPAFKETGEEEMSSDDGALDNEPVTALGKSNVDVSSTVNGTSSSSTEDKSADASKNEVSDSSTVNDVTGTGTVACPGDAATKQEITNSAESDEEEPDTFQLAWEAMEMAKYITLHQESKDELRLADIYLCLGEIAMETAQYDVAVEDLKRCVALRKSTLGEASRIVAEGLFTLGLALVYDNQFDKGIECYTEVIDIFVKCLESLEKSSATSKEVSEVDNKERETLQLLIADVKSKMFDTKESAQLYMSRVQEPLAKVGTSGSVGGPTKPYCEPTEATTPQPSVSNGTAAKDISHMVRKKTKSPAVIGDPDSSKKQKLDESEP